MGSSETQEGVGPSGEILGTTVSGPSPSRKPQPRFWADVPVFYSETEATTYEVIFGAAFEVESHWPAGKVPPWAPGAPPSAKPIKAQSPPRQSLDTCICPQDWKQVRRTREGLQLRGRRGGLGDPVPRGWGWFAGQRMDIFPKSDRR